MQTRSVTIALFLVFALFVVVAAVLGMVRWRLPVWYSLVTPASTTVAARIALLR